MSMAKWPWITPGIPDDQFVRGQVPMTKEEVRVLTISKLRLAPSHVVYDIGAGTGSVTVEVARLIGKGYVYAVEKGSAGQELINRNCKQFGIENVYLVHGVAPHCLRELPPADRIVVGGSGANLVAILDTCHTKLKSNGILVINCITLETLWQSLEILQNQLQYQVDVCLLTVSKLEPLGTKRAFKSLNPIYIIQALKGV